ncbi:hypothetical protein Ciccas_003363 [Cichlidogyrus casuarinus]|uniref:Uncharacterized protein n=1 Tax=Cichlidogyrus casuarinus TaxID=1844966 RepID=A0ABD2QEK1_9PLAT
MLQEAMVGIRAEVVEMRCCREERSQEAGNGARNSAFGSLETIIQLNEQLGKMRPISTCALCVHFRQHSQVDTEPAYGLRVALNFAVPASTNGQRAAFPLPASDHRIASQTTAQLSTFPLVLIPLTSLLLMAGPDWQLVSKYSMP